MLIDRFGFDSCAAEYEILKLKRVSNCFRNLCGAGVGLIYEKHTKNGQAEWFHLYGQNSLDEAKAAHRTAEVLATPTLSKKEAKRKAKEDKQVAKEAARLATKIAKRKAKLAKQEQKRQAKAGISPRLVQTVQTWR